MVAIKKYKKAFDSLFLLTGANESARRILTESEEIKICKFTKNQIIYSESDFQHSLGLILKGEAKVYKGKVHMSELKCGDVFGAVAVYSARTRFATTVKAKTDTLVAFLPKTLIDKLMKADVTVAQNYIAYLSERIYYLNGKIAGFTKATALQKLENYIANTGDRELEAYSATELAKHLGIGRASLYRAMAKIKQNSDENKEKNSNESKI